MKILSIDEDRRHQAPIAEAFNRAGFVLRFVADRKKTLTGLRQLKPNLLLVHGEVRSLLVADVLTAACSDPAFANLPIALLCSDLSDSPFLSGLRSGIVDLIGKPFSATEHVSRVRNLLTDLPTRTGTVVGTGTSEQLTSLIEHLRRTRRSGVVTLNARTALESRAAFVGGTLESASMLGAEGVEALVAMVAQPRASWTFTEVGGAGGEGTGVVIEVGEAGGGEEEEEEIVQEGEEPLGAFEVEFEDEAEPAVEPERPEPARLLLVDDDSSLCAMFTLLFEKRGFTVRAAHDGLEGYEAAIADPVDVVIADLNMPRMDGWGMLRMLRDDYRTRELPVAFLSCHDDYRDSLRALNAGAQAYLSKGTRLEALVSAVRELLAPREKLARELATGAAVAISTASVGSQWLVRQLGRQRFTGRMDLRDGWATYQLFFQDGTPVHAYALSGKHSADGERAFNAFIASKAAEGTLAPGIFPAPVTLTLDGEAQISRAAKTMNDNERRVREASLVSAGEIAVNRDLYAVYAQVGPKARLEAARLICEEKLSPREVIARSNASPLDVEETMRDLLRRGVVSLNARS